MFEFKRVEITTLGRTLTGSGVAELNTLGREGWQIKAAVRNLTGNSEVIYLEREVEPEDDD